MQHPEQMQGMETLPPRHARLCTKQDLENVQAVSLDRFAADLAVVLAVDWLLDRCRTVVNLMGDTFGTFIIDRLCQKSLTY